MIASMRQCAPVGMASREALQKNMEHLLTPSRSSASDAIFHSIVQSPPFFPIRRHWHCGISF